MPVNVLYRPCGRKPLWDVWACLNCDVRFLHELKRTNKKQSGLKARKRSHHWDKTVSHAGVLHWKLSPPPHPLFTTNSLAALAPPISVNPFELSEAFWAAGNKNLSIICSTGASKVTAGVFTALQFCLRVIKLLYSGRGESPLVDFWNTFLQVIFREEQEIVQTLINVSSLHMNQDKVIFLSVTTMLGHFYLSFFLSCLHWKTPKSNRNFCQKMQDSKNRKSLIQWNYNSPIIQMCFRLLLWFIEKLEPDYKCLALFGFF